MKRVGEQKRPHNADLFYQPHQVIEEFLFDDLTVLPECDRAELDRLLQGENR